MILSFSPFLSDSVLLLECLPKGYSNNSIDFSEVILATAWVGRVALSIHQPNTAFIAQLVEQLLSKHQVVGSNPSKSSKFNKEALCLLHVEVN